MIHLLSARDKVLAQIALQLAEIDNFRGRSGEVVSLVAPYCNSDSIVTYRLSGDNFSVAYTHRPLKEEYGRSFSHYEIPRAAYDRMVCGDMLTCVEARDLGFVPPCLEDETILSAIVFPITVDGGIEGLVVFASHTTEDWPQDTVDWLSTVMALLTGAMRRTIANERLSEQLAWRDKIYPIIAHDLRSSISSMHMLFEAMDTTTDHTEHEELYNMMRNNASDAFVLLDNLLKWSRSSLHGNLQANMEMVDFLELIRSVVRYFAPVARIKGVDLVTDFRCDECQTRLDCEMISTVMRNLISNAIKFTPAGGKVTVGMSLSEASIGVWVEDTGVGLSTEDMESINGGGVSSLRRGTGGESTTGFGLTLAREFIELHGGRLNVSSTACVGSRFSFSLSQLC